MGWRRRAHIDKSPRKNRPRIRTVPLDWNQRAHGYTKCKAVNELIRRRATVASFMKYDFFIPFFIPIPEVLYDFFLPQCVRQR